MPTHAVNGYSEEYSGESTFLEKIGANTDSFLQKSFERWGKICAERPWLILFIGLCAVVAFGHGVKYLKVTTDPVELWASPTSRSRVEREYFDKHFEPFYRTEQIIIRAVGLDNVIHNTSNGVIEFGPALNDSFLRSVFELQQQIKAIEGLEEICFAPLRTKDQVKKSTKECVVQSFWGWYQDDMSKFNTTSEDSQGFTTNYLDAFVACTQ